MPETWPPPLPFFLTKVWKLFKIAPVPPLPNPKEKWRLPVKKMELTALQLEECHDPVTCAARADEERIWRQSEIFDSYQMHSPLAQYNMLYVLYALGSHLGARTTHGPPHPFPLSLVYTALSCVNGGDRERAVVAEYFRLLGYCLARPNLDTLLASERPMPSRLPRPDMRYRFEAALDCSNVDWELPIEPTVYGRERKPPAPPEEQQQPGTRRPRDD